VVPRGPQAHVGLPFAGGVGRRKACWVDGVQPVVQWWPASRARGQLGLNGQLLTTNAPLHCDEPVAYGIEGVCDRCQIGARRCPLGAIPNHRTGHLGITKAKLNTKTCVALMMHRSGCSISHTDVGVDLGPEPRRSHTSPRKIIHGTAFGPP